MKYSKGKARECRARLAEAEKNVKRYELICDNDPSQNNVINNLEVAKQEYELLHDYIVRGCIVRSRINWYENGEKNSKYFLNLEKTRRSKTAVRRLYDSKGKITVNPRSMINEFRHYYQTLYSNHDSEEGEEFASDSDFLFQIALMRGDGTRFGANIKSRLGGDEIRGNIKLCVEKI